MEEFGSMLEKLSKEQIILCRDIRRRGKNKVQLDSNIHQAEAKCSVQMYDGKLFQVAAQNCRKRRQEQATELEEEIEKIRGRKEKLLKEREYLVVEMKRWTDLTQRLEDHIQNSLEWQQYNFLKYN